MGILDNYEAADQAFHTKAVLTQDNATLLEHLHGLSNQNNINEGTQHRDIIRGITINNILLQRHIDSLQKHITDLNASNTKIQWWVIALAIAALITATVQTAVAIRSEWRASQEPQSVVQPLRPSTTPAAGPIQAPPPSSNQAVPKKP